MTAPSRTLVFWVPDWPIHALLRDQEAADEPQERVVATRAAESPGISEAPGAAEIPGISEAPDAAIPPIALLAQHRVVACSAAARAEGVRTGLREREAQSRCPTLVVHPHDPEVDGRRFAPVIAALEQLIPGIELRRPGLCAMRVRGPARYYGGEEPAAAALLRLAAELGLPLARVGIADGLFAAEQAVRATATTPGIEAPAEAVRIVPPGGSAAFLSPLPVSRAASAGFADLLVGLGIRTLGALAALPEDAVQQRFGAEGLTAHRRAAALGQDRGAEVRPRDPVRERAIELTFEPPIDTTEQLAFACATLAERFISALTADRLVCTALRIELTDDVGLRHEREWLHPHRFTAADTVGRIRWQAASAVRETERGGAGITHVRITPTHTDRAAAHEPGLWSTEPDTRVHHHLSRAQSTLGHTGVGTMELTGGRLLGDRQRFVPWSTARSRERGSRASAAGPWPGSLSGATPSRVFPSPLPSELLDAEGRAVGVDEDDLLTATPVRLRVGDLSLTETVQEWSLPWALRERWWQGTPTRFRLQLQLEGGDAWLLFHESARWFAEGRYD
ncbi:DNA polymerase Y family protein [Leucobacter rhizosphaerae]|uniref:DNA polymerase Y family protein n=1 Tax=Leucobacter rhizosphaerae TaxID=2932245 RepID=A0ABY4FWN5_9MICO|nr:DNA polymerase Y family protein [Leucobacter rhizosphaerae]UOQ60646.1 DNA polymerase Y family protein [Leucobacter rhizosphaerae]